MNYHSAWINKGIERMSKFFRKNLDEDQTTEYLEAIVDICTNQQIFKETVDSTIETSKFFPTIREIKNTYKDIRNGKYKTGELSFNQITDCVLCGGYGVVTAIKDNNEFAYACKCKAGDTQSIARHKFHPLKYAIDINLNAKETKIYDYLKTFGAKKLVTRLAETCPF